MHTCSWRTCPKRDAASKHKIQPASFGQHAPNMRSQEGQGRYQRLVERNRPHRAEALIGIIGNLSVPFEAMSRALNQNNAGICCLWCDWFSSNAMREGTHGFFNSMKAVHPPQCCPPSALPLLRTDYGERECTMQNMRTAPQVPQPQRLKPTSWVRRCFRWNRCRVGA